jgi:hypothetical protein
MSSISVTTEIVVPLLMLLVAGLSSRSPGFAAGLDRVGFVVVKVALGQNYVSASSLILPVNIISLWLSILIYHLGDGRQF